MKLIEWAPLLTLTIVATPSLSRANIFPGTVCRHSKSIQELSRWGIKGFGQDSLIEDSSTYDLIRSIRAGSTEADTDEPTDDSDAVVSDEEDYSDYDEYDEYDEDETEENEVEEEQQAEKNEVAVVYDEPLQPTMTIQLGTTIGVIMLCRRLDLYEPKVVRIARFVFIAYMVFMQAFMAYVRIKAKLLNDRTPITLSSPLTSLVQSQLQQKGGSGNGSDMVKEMASQFLSSESTVMEYDLKQVKSLNGSLLFSLLFMWILHFKMNQIQPLFLQTASGLTNLFFNPLFQIYVLGRNLERPFKNPKFGALQEKMESDRKAMSEQAKDTEEAIDQQDETKEDEDASDAEDGDEETDTDEEGEVESSDEDDDDDDDE